MAIKTGWIEKRTHERIAATLRVSYRVVPKGDVASLLSGPDYRDTTVERLPDLAKTSRVVKAVTRDLTVRGLALAGPEPFVEGDAVAVFLYLPDAPTPVTLVAEVVHAEEAGGGEASYRAGLRMMAINREDVVRLEKYLLTQKLKGGGAVAKPRNDGP